MPQRDEVDAEVPVIEAIQGGDRYAFGELVSRQSRWVRGVIFGVLGDQDGVDDVAQQVWTAVWLRIEKLRDVQRWRPWLYRLARNAAIDAGRELSRNRKRTQVLAEGTQDVAAVRSPAAGLAGSELHGEVLAAVESLPAMYREPFVMRHLSGWSYAEIADVMGMPVDSIETRLVRARRFLRESLRDKVR